jgi:hypothetical protein
MDYFYIIHVGNPFFHVLKHAPPIILVTNIATAVPSVNIRKFVENLSTGGIDPTVPIFNRIRGYIV